MTLRAKMVTIDCAEPAELARWWSTVLETAEPQDFGDFCIVPAEPLVLGFQRVPEGKRTKNRVHVDFAATQAEVARLTGLGASVIGEGSIPGLTWTVLQDPAGNEFCVSDPHD